MRCPDCCKMVSLDTETDPEVNVEVDEGHVTGSVRITNNCADCGTELRAADFDVDESAQESYENHRIASAENGLEVDHEMEAECDFTRTEESEGKGRGAKRFYGASGSITVTCSCGWSTELPWSDRTQASHMEEC